MRTRTVPNGSADRHVRKFKGKTRRKFSAEEKTHVDLICLSEESSIFEPSPRNAGIRRRMLLQI